MLSQRCTNVVAQRYLRVLAQRCMNVIEQRYFQWVITMERQLFLRAARSNMLLQRVIHVSATSLFNLGF